THNCEFAEDRVLVAIKHNNTRSYNTIDFKNYGISKVENIFEPNVHALISDCPIDNETLLCMTLEEPSRQNVIDIINKLSNREDVLFVEPDYKLTQCSIPNDYYYEQGEQWGLNGLNGIDIEKAWNVTQGTDKIKVGIIDRGIDFEHPDLVNMIDLNLSAKFGNSFREYVDEHGTSVAGIIGAEINNGIGIAGISHNVQLVSLKIDFSEGMYVSGLVDAVEFAIANDIPILCNGTSYQSYAKPSNSLTKVLQQYKGLFVNSAGNSHSNVDKYNYSPADSTLDNVIVVGALDKDGKRPYFSNYGLNSVSIYAPGEYIYTTVPVDACIEGKCNKTEHISNGYHSVFGTSFSAPHVAGVAALMLSENSNLTGAKLKECMLAWSDTITIGVPQSTEGVTQRVKKLNAYNCVKDVKNANSYSHLYLKMTNGPECKQEFFVKKGSPWPAKVNIPEAPFGYEFKGYYYGVDYAADTQHAVYLENGNFNSRNYYFKQDNFNASGDITLQGRWMPKEYYFILGNRHAADWDHPLNGMVGSRNYEESISKLAADKDTVNGVTKAFTHWEMSIGNDEPIIYTTDLQLEFTVKEIVDRYCRNYDALGKPSICFYAIYNTNVSSGGGGSCLAPGSLITLADGTQKAVELLDGSESLLVWDMYTGSFASAPILFIDGDPLDLHDVINLYFSDGTTVEVIYEHAFWDCNLNEYVFLRNDADKYIGHWFNKQTVGADGGMSWTSVQLIDVVITQEYTTTWSPVTYGHLCYYVNGMLSMPGATEGLINIFDVDGDTLKYNEASMAADIEKYGLFTYEEFAEMYTVSENIFNAFNGQYLKVSLGKGLITAEQIEYLINRYSQYFDL
ncbi:MAG: S8 family serine peptidase, partial [Clostridia bacterium]|nr:S8 family serine peptidase [Clostridia bacterium]